MLAHKQSTYVLGRGAAAAAAQQGAMKFKEIGFIHAEAYPGGELKHGPFAIITKGMPIILIILEDEYKSSMISTLEEVNARYALPIVITNENPSNVSSNPIPRNKAAVIIEIPNAGLMTPLLSVVVM